MITLTEDQRKALQAELEELLGLNAWCNVTATNIEIDGLIPFDDLYKAMLIIQKYAPSPEYRAAMEFQDIKERDAVIQAQIKSVEVLRLQESLRMLEDIKRRHEEFGKLLGME